MSADFAELVAGVQVGTRKAAPARATEFPLEGPAERTLLAELGTLGLMRRAGRTAVPATALPTAPTETLQIAKGAAVPLAQALEKALPAALEWAEVAAKRGYVAPPAILSKLVPLAAKHSAFRAVLGERGRWLAEIMEVALPEPVSEEAITLEAFEGLGSHERTAALERLKPHADDLPVLQKGLADRRKEVREMAAERIVRLPNSPEAQALRELAQRAVAVKRSLLRSSLEVVPPDPDFLPAWLPRAFARPGWGEGARALYDLVRHVPPALWERPPDDLLALAERTDYRDALVSGWGDAALRFDDQAWIDALLSHTASATYASRASEAAFDAETIPRLKRDGKEGGAAFSLLSHRDRPFSPALTRAAVEAARRGQAPIYLLNDLGMRLDLEAIPLLESSWAEQGPLEALRDRWRSTLDLRRRLLESLR